MRWQLIIKEFGPNIQHISGVDNIESDTLRRFPSVSIDKYNTSTMKYQCQTKKLFAIGREENIEDCFPLNILNVQRKIQKELRNINSKLST